MSGGSQQLRMYRIARRDGATREEACASSGISISEAKSWDEDDARNPPSEECYVLLGAKLVHVPDPSPVVLVGDCRALMAAMPDCSVDSIVTDPPYELGFMGKAWDSTGIAYDAEMWRQCFRVLKPGGHLLSFSGSRTYHRMAVAIEDAEFEIRDQLMWIYGSGFPKSHDVSKAIDRIDTVGPLRERAEKFVQWMRSTGITPKRVNELTGSSMASHYMTNGSQPAVATRAHLEAMRGELPVIPDWVEALVDSRTVESENMARREVIGVDRRFNEASGIVSAGRNERTLVDRKITKAHTPEAARWSGWGTALKPAHEPICMARKPLIGTVAQNVLTHGTGGINIDACRVECDDKAKFPKGYGKGLGNTYAGDDYSRSMICKDDQNTTGRFPANVLHDGEAGLGEEGRFFYSAKASRADREAGVHVEEGRGNVHPTVKPTDVMRWLVRMVTPPGGLVLDPFNGSGSTGRAAVLEGFRYVGCELSEEYAAIARARIAEAVETMSRPVQIRTKAKRIVKPKEIKDARVQGDLFA